MTGDVHGRATSRNLKLIVAGQGISYLGDYLAFFFALPIFVRDRTADAESLGLLFAAETSAVLVFGFISGVFLDRVRLRRAVVFADLTRAAAFGLLAMAVVMDVAAVWMAFAVAFVVGSMGTVFDSGLQSLMPMALDDDQLPTVNGGIEFVRNLAMAGGFVTAGEILERSGGFAGAFAFDGLTYLVSIAALLAIRQVRRRPEPRHEPVGKALRVGLAFLWRTRPLRWATVAAVATNFAFAPLAAVLVLYAEVELGIVAEAELGRFFAVFSLIAAGFGMAAPAVMRRIGVGRSVILGGFLFGTGALAAGIVSGWWAVLPFGLATGGVAINQSAFVTLRQRLTPPDRLGRVIAASRTAAFAGLPLGAYFGALLGDSIGLRPLFIAGGTVIAVASLLLVTGPLGNRDRQRPPGVLTPLP